MDVVFDNDVSSKLDAFIQAYEVPQERAITDRADRRYGRVEPGSCLRPEHAVLANGHVALDDRRNQLTALQASRRLL